MLAAAMDAAERFQPAFHFVILGGMAAEGATQAAFFEQPERREPVESPTIALIGAGAMGGALVRGWIAAVRKGGGLTLSVVEPHFDPELEAALEAAGAELNPAAPGPADVLVLAVKPQSFAQTAADARRFVGPETRVLSIMAGITIETLARGWARRARTRHAQRASADRPGVTAYVAAPAYAPDRASERYRALSVDAGRGARSVTAVSGSGPAHVFLLAECLAAAAEQEGIDRDTAQRLASATVAGAGALMLETGETAGALRKQVTSPGGTTEAALDILGGADGLGPLLRRAVAAATQRSRGWASSAAFKP